jgi:hypothetical protein
VIHETKKKSLDYIPGIAMLVPIASLFTAFVWSAEMQMTSGIAAEFGTTGIPGVHQLSKER